MIITAADYQECTAPHRAELDAWATTIDPTYPSSHWLAVEINDAGELHVTRLWLDEDGNTVVEGDEFKTETIDYGRVTPPPWPTVMFAKATPKRTEHRRGGSADDVTDTRARNTTDQGSD